MLTAEVRQEIEECIKLGKDKIMLARQQLLAVLKQHHLMRCMQTEPDCVAPHPANRDGYGLSPTDVHALLENILEVGFDASQTCGLCVEMSDEQVEACHKFIERLVEVSGDLLPAWQKKQARYGSLSGSHLNAALRCIKHGSKHPIEGSNVTAPGKLSLSLLQELDPAFASASAVKDGVSWICVSNAVAQVEGVRALLQEAPGGPRLERRILGVLAQQTGPRLLVRDPSGCHPFGQLDILKLA